MQSGPAYCEAFLNVLRNVTKEEAVQYVLALIEDMLSGIAWPIINAKIFPSLNAFDVCPRLTSANCAVDPARAQLFHQQSDIHLATLPDPYGIFLR